MKVRFDAIVFFLVLAITFSLGVFLLISAEEMPAPGIILMAASGVALVWYLMRSTKRATTNSSLGVLEKERQNYEEDVDRRRREEPDRW